MTLYDVATASIEGYGQDAPAQAEHAVDELDGLRTKHKDLTGENATIKRELVQALAADCSGLDRENRAMRELLDYLRNQPQMPPRTW